MYTLKSDLRQVPDYKWEELDRYLANSPLAGSGRDFVEAGRKYGVNPVYIMSLGILESNWGRSNYAQTRHNLFGYQAYDSNPDMAATFSSFAGCIHFITQFLANSYLQPRNGKVYQLLNGQWGNVGQWWGGAATLEGVYKVGDLAANGGKYATAPHAAQAVCNIMNQFVAFIARPVGTTGPVNPEPNKPTEGTQEYTVVAGDNLSRIAERFLGNWARYHEIVALNKIPDANKIFVGQKIKIPSSRIPQPSPQPVPSVRTHTVASGETLWAIAQKYYGTGVEWKKIYEANKDVIANPNIIRVGQVIKIPA